MSMLPCETPGRRRAGLIHKLSVLGFHEPA